MVFSQITRAKQWLTAASTAALVVAGFVLSVGCSTNGPQGSHPKADIAVRNDTKQSLDQVTIVWDRQELRCGMVSAGGLARVYEAGLPKGATSEVALITFVEDRTRHPRTIVVNTAPITQQTGSYQAIFAIKSLTNAEVIVAPKPW